MTQTILADMDTWKRIAGNADQDGAFTVLVINPSSNALLSQMLVKLDNIVTNLTGIRARLDAGIKTQTVTAVASL